MAAVARVGADPVILLREVSFTYGDDSSPALCNVSLAVGRGELVVVMGASGAGKTTLAKCLNRTIPSFQPGTLTGEIHILGRRLIHEGVAELAGIVGLVSQDFEAQLFSTNVTQEITFAMEQLGVPQALMRERILATLAAVGLTGLDRRDPATLSGGEKQRLAIAAVLALRPPIFVLDEPTTDLDPVGKREIFTVLDRLRHDGYTLVLIEHEIAAAEHADRVLLMEKGQIVAADSPAAILPQVALLQRHGVRPSDLDQIAARLRLRPERRSLEDLAGLLHAHPATEEGDRHSTTAVGAPSVLHVESATYQYDSGHTALDGVTLQVGYGDSIAIIGENGSGKTTLAKLLNGLLAPCSGRVLLHGQPIGELSLHQVASEVGYVFQNPDHQIFEATVYDEVAFGPRNLGLSASAVAERVDESLTAVGLRGSEGRDPFLFGKGQRQRLAVASLLALRPRVLILDEPTTGLDYPEQREMMHLVTGLQRTGMALIVITHTPWLVAEYARRVVLLAHGRLLFDGSPRQLFAKEDLLERCHFRTPDVTRLARRLGLTLLSIDELVRSVTVADE